MVCLIGKPSEVGNTLGSKLSIHIVNRAKEFQKLLSGKRLGSAEEKKVDAFYDLLAQETPHWIEEYDALASAAGVPFRTVLTLNCVVTLTAVPSCTSALALGERTEQGFPLLLKVRDEKFQHQAMGYRRLPGTHGMLFSTDACNLGIGQGCNEHGLAVANNTGGMVPEKAYPMGFNDCQMTRLLLERARDVDEALAVFTGLQKEGKIGLVDRARGMIFIMADAKGQGMILEASPDECEYKKADNGLFVWSNHWLLPGSERFTPPIDSNNILVKSSVLRYERGCELLKDVTTVSIDDLKTFSRDEKNEPDSICNGTDKYPWRTVSSFIYTLDPALSHPVHVAAGNPSKTDYQEISLWTEETPESYLLEWKA